LVGSLADTSKALSQQAADKRAELAKLSGKAFDKRCVSFDIPSGTRRAHSRCYEPGARRHHSCQLSF